MPASPTRSFHVKRIGYLRVLPRTAGRDFGRRSASRNLHRAGKRIRSRRQHLQGKVTRVLPGMQSAFVDIGLDGDAFLYVSDVFENLEDYEHGQPSEQHAPRTAVPAIAAGNGSTVELLPGE